MASTTASSVTPVVVPALYAEQWDDGFGARGWKLDLPDLGADVIAGTPYAGERIPTSVFVHDLVDHHLCGFRLSGYLDEAGALIQLAERTGSDPVADFQQIIDEDLLSGLAAGPDWQDLLPASLVAEIDPSADSKAMLQNLPRKLGDGLLRALFTGGFVHEGWLRRDTARSTWTARGLDYAARERIALALQELFEWMDAQAQACAWPRARGNFSIGNHAVEFRFTEPARQGRVVAVASPPEIER